MDRRQLWLTKVAFCICPKRELEWIWTPPCLECEKHQDPTSLTPKRKDQPNIYEYEENRTSNIRLGQPETSTQRLTSLGSVVGHGLTVKEETQKGRSCFSMCVIDLLHTGETYLGQWVCPTTCPLVENPSQTGLCTWGNSANLDFTRDADDVIARGVRCPGKGCTL